MMARPELGSAEGGAGHHRKYQGGGNRDRRRQRRIEESDRDEPFGSRPCGASHRGQRFHRFDGRHAESGRGSRHGDGSGDRYDRSHFRGGRFGSRSSSRHGISSKRALLWQCRAWTLIQPLPKPSNLSEILKELKNNVCSARSTISGHNQYDR